jgi:hypothetical protein
MILVRSPTGCTGGRPLRQTCLLIPAGHFDTVSVPRADCRVCIGGNPVKAGGSSAYHSPACPLMLRSSRYHAYAGGEKHSGHRQILISFHRTSPRTHSLRTAGAYSARTRKIASFTAGSARCDASMPPSGCVQRTDGPVPCGMCGWAMSSWTMHGGLPAFDHQSSTPPSPATTPSSKASGASTASVDTDAELQYHLVLPADRGAIFTFTFRVLGPAVKIVPAHELTAERCVC